MVFSRFSYSLSIILLSFLLLTQTSPAIAGKEACRKLDNAWRSEVASIVRSYGYLEFPKSRERSTVFYQPRYTRCVAALKFRLPHPSGDGREVVYLTFQVLISKSSKSWVIQDHALRLYNNISINSLNGGKYRFFKEKTRHNWYQYKSNIVGNNSPYYYFFQLDISDLKRTLGEAKARDSSRRMLKELIPQVLAKISGSAVSTVPSIAVETPNIRLANPNDAELGNIETSFYEVTIPSDKKLGLMREPSVRSAVVAALPNGTGDIRIRKLGYVGNRKWANICASSKCGWAIAKHLRRQNQQSTSGTKLVEVAFPTAEIFSKPSVNSRKIRTLTGGKSVALKEIITNEYGDGWIRICGSGWCGWALQDMFSPVR